MPVKQMLAGPFGPRKKETLLMENEIILHLSNIEKLLSNNDSIIIAVISTLVGVFAGYFLNYIQNLKGKVNIFPIEYSFARFQDYEGFSDSSTANTFEETNSITINIKFDVVNTKNTKEFLRNIKLCISNSEISNDFKIKDVSTWRYDGLSEKMNELECINIESSTVMHISGRVYLDQKECNKIKNNVSLSIKYLDGNNRKKEKVLIRKEDIKYS